MIRYLDTPDGYFVSLYGHLGCIEATIHQPEKHRSTWRLCFATCTGEASKLQGQVRDFKTLIATKHDLQHFDRWMNAEVTPIPGFGGLPKIRTNVGSGPRAILAEMRSCSSQ